ncbi:transferrin [Nilaparvata lugens]|uniref:transferrin n=1 Tax=Nilaparvata lugens TaxID=108931 RepID=UPI00193E80A5|nr:transferrin [Nilaparvata lugens]
MFYVPIELIWPRIAARFGPLSKPLLSELIFRIFMVFVTIRICALRRSRNFRVIYDACENLVKSKAPLKCEYALDRIDCLQKISSGEADFGILEAEELLIAKNNPSIENILIVSMFQRSSALKRHEYEMVAVVTSSMDIVSLKDLRNRRFCHPGYDLEGNEEDWSDIFSLYFEDQVVPQACDENRTVAENRVKSLADFFEISCKAGTWAMDPKLDSALKSKYGSMCQTCDEPDKCTFRDKYWGRKGVLNCLSDCMGDVAWARLDDLLNHFKVSSTYSSYLNTNNLRVCNRVKLLCPNGTTQPLHSPNPCVWVARPNTVVAANSKIASGVQELIKGALVDYTTGESFRSDLNKLLENSPRQHIEELRTPAEYLDNVPGFLSSVNSYRCGSKRTIEVCGVAAREVSQCQWLSAAAASYGVEPDIRCVTPAAGTNCFQAVADGKADVFFTNSDQLMVAVRDYGLAPLLYETVHDYLHFKYYGALVDTSAGIQTLADLKGKKACFTSVDGVGKLTNKSSSINLTYKSPKMHQFLSVSGDNHAGNEREAVDCLISGGGQIAILSVDSVKKFALAYDMFTEFIRKQIGTRFQWLCEDNRLQEKPCFLTWTTMGQILVNPKLSSTRKEDIISTFKNLDTLFGERHKIIGSSPFAFDMFAGFDSKDDIFQMSGDSLELADSYLRKTHALAVSYESQIKELLHCQLDQFKSNSIPLRAAISFRYLLTVYTTVTLLMVFTNS